MKKINFKSDFDFIAEVKAIGADDNKVAIDFPQYDWEIILTTDDCCNNSRTYVVSHRKGVATNCYNDNGKIHIICDNHKLSAGQLHMELRSFLPNSNYPDGTQKVVATYDLDIELTTENTGITSAEVQIVLPFLYDSIYRIAQQSGYDGTQEEYYQLASQLPNAVETANKVQGSATSLVDSATAIAEGANTIKSSADTLQENADKVSESATKVEQAVEPLVQASESLDATKQAFELLSSEWTDGRQAIATALTNRRYPTEPSESFHAMADKITNMSYQEGWFAKIGYTDENDGGIKEIVDYSYNVAKSWNPDGGTENLFRSDANLIFAPNVDLSNYLNCSSMFRDCSNLMSSAIKPKIATNLSWMYGQCSKLLIVSILEQDSYADCTAMFHNCPALREVVGNLKANALYQTFYSCSNLIQLDSIDVGEVTKVQQPFYTVPKLTKVTFKNLGKSSLTTYDFSGASVWGTSGEENRQSLIDSLITYSYDRASAGMATATIKLSTNTKALLTEEEIAQITAKGFTLA